MTRRQVAASWRTQPARLGLWLMLVLLFQTGCSSTVPLQSTVKREAPTGLSLDEGVSVVLDEAMLETLRSVGRNLEGSQTTPAALEGSEETVARCIFDALEKIRPDVRTIPPRVLRKAAFPTRSLEPTPVTARPWEQIALDPRVRARLAASEIRYLVVVDVDQGKGSSSSKGVNMIIAGSLRSEWETWTEMTATVVDIKLGRRVGTLSTRSTGSEGFSVMYYLMYPLVLYHGDQTHDPACNSLGSAIAQFLSHEVGLFAAVQRGDVKEVKRFITEGAFPDARNDRGETALHVAASDGKIEAAALLIASGADSNARSASGDTPLMRAVGINDPDMSLLLIANGADVHASDSNGDTVLHMAAEFTGTAVSESLIEQGADVNALNNQGETPPA